LKQKVGISIDADILQLTKERAAERPMKVPAKQLRHVHKEDAWDL
jgi:hypothetical protein